MKRFLPLLSMIALFSCSQEEEDAVTLWHFWSEPHQRTVLEEQVRQFEAENPGIKVRLTELSWADGKAKLQLAFNAGTQPDIVHLGWDWEEEFRSQGVLLGGDGPVTHRADWFQNARALVQWTGDDPEFRWGLCRSDAHNVIKRCLPLIWESGAPNFYATRPIHEHMDADLVLALQALRDTARANAVIEPSRRLDERFLRGEVRYLYTGAWIRDMAHAQSVSTLEVIPQRSILNGDALCLTEKSKKAEQASQLITYLSSYENVRDFCVRVPDAGFPVDDRSFSDTAFTGDALSSGFLQTAKLSVPLPASPVMLSIEPVIEELIERVYDATSTEEVQRLVDDARAKVKELESAAS